jgi:hypothetical protein
MRSSDCFRPYSGREPVERPAVGGYRSPVTARGRAAREQSQRRMLARRRAAAAGLGARA